MQLSLHIFDMHMQAQMPGRGNVRGNNLPTSFVTNSVVDGFQLFYYLPKCWSLCWILIPALLDQSVSRYHYKYQQNVNTVINNYERIKTKCWERNYVKS